MSRRALIDWMRFAERLALQTAEKSEVTYVRQLRDRLLPSWKRDLGSRSGDCLA
ncbi:MAG: hypothetical protein ACOYEP_11510 [Limnochordia bacterium]|jgi:hypothetical protein